ncbi:alpha/beta hydrolase [Pseudomonas putida]|nr:MULTISPECIES: alpha/beta hydrolase [unclassified Pseudomonas]MBF8747253.1 alpha/beta hydrolase [Pseudomonas monteilii]MCT8164938.1 alpha/beta hydrolase [Pseudomonas sp. HD6422]MCT8183836.1 alpha/beta hydrolase [Pseudomonas sp. HD6421]
MPMRRLMVSLVVLVLALMLIVLFGFRITAIADFRLEPWHTYVPEELDANTIDRSDWAGYVNAEAKLFAALQQEMREQLATERSSAYNRFDASSRVYPGNLTRDWNRSYIAEPSQSPKGAVVLLHGLTDSPYSLRHLASHFQAKGYVVVAIRLPGHGSVPAGLSAAHWEDWMAATRLAVREATRRAPGQPLYLVGFSNGGALAVKYALDALARPELSRPDHLILLSPMIGVSRFARFAGIAGLPALFPAFAKAAWLSVLPEFNPFKYNSFPVNAARQSYELTEALRQQLLDAGKNPQRLQALAPIVTYQSLVDGTVSTAAIQTELYDRLPANGSELVIFDTNTSLGIDDMLRPAVAALREQLFAAPARRYARTLVGARGQGDARMRSLRYAAGSTAATEQMLAASYPNGLFSLSHVALPFPLDDALYGQQPSQVENYGVHLGTLSMRGERGALILDAGNFSRATSNPFFQLMLDNLDRTAQLR